MSNEKKDNNNEDEIESKKELNSNNEDTIVNLKSDEHNSISDLDTETFEEIAQVKIVRKEDEEIEEPENNVHQTRMERKKNNKNKKHKKEKKVKLGKDGKPKKITLKRILFVILIIFLIFIVVLGCIFGGYVIKHKGNVKDAVLNMASDFVGEQKPIFVLLLGISADIKTELTDTIILCGYNPKTQKAFMLSIPRDTYVGKNPAYANGFDKINAKYMTSAERTVEYVELITGVNIDYYCIVRNLSISNIFSYIGSVDFNVPIDMNYDDKTQDLHIHLKKGMQTLEPDQIEQLLRFRHNNDGSSYPSSWGDNDYGRMKTQREFIKAVIDQKVSLANLNGLKSVVEMVYTNVQTNMSGYQVLEYVPSALQFKTSELRSEQLPGQSAIINSLWFYNHSKSKTKTLMDELIIYLELDEETLRSHYKYADEVIGKLPSDNWKSETVIEDEYIPPSLIKNVPDEKVDPTTCNHDFAIIDQRDATCTEEGYIKYRCILCDTEKTDTIPINGNHSWGEWTTTKAATCTEAGSRSRTCSACAKTETETIPAGNHQWGTKGDASKATCTTASVQLYECSSCHKTETREVSPKLGHDMQPQGSPTTATCTTASTQTYKCSRCDTTETREVSPKLGHDMQPQGSPTTADCENPSTQTYKCSRCDVTETREVSPALGHSYDSGVVTTEPTETTPGIKTFTCSRCSKTYTEEIPATGGGQ